MRPLSFLLVLLSAVAFAAGAVLPLLKLQPRAGQWTPVMNVLAPAHFGEKEVTLLGGIGAMWGGGEQLLAVGMGFFSVFLPLAKLSLLCMEALAPGQLPGPARQALGIVARFAMVEVFVVALFVLLAKELPGGSRVEVGAGGWAFVFSVVLGLCAGQFHARGARL